jgi:hypothetical protein
MTDTDKERIMELERDNSLLKEALRYFVKNHAYDHDYIAAAERCRERAQDNLHAAELLDGIAHLLK